MNLMISPLAESLFHKVLYQSGGMKLRTLAKSESDADAFIIRLLEIDGLPDVPGGDVKAYLKSTTAKAVVPQLVADSTVVTKDDVTLDDIFHLIFFAVRPGIPILEPHSTGP